ncbi:MAG: LpxL/LpxP family Kdo(2)-lipid IV(A) lauroyl/palmitoleoyl acyltransferase [Gammaproteobacteria bacterium]|nr:MAG: LpxL/LpxP family Kdo(2)-lipid IV(A) lauroyl/palmitoleoyl acyltransferase [Gammaproteobacteria bacterium]
MYENQQYQWHFLHPRYWLTWLGIGCWWLLVMLPYPLIVWLGTQVGAVMYWIGGYRREIAEINLKLCFPDMDEAQRRKLLRDNFTSYGIAFFEIGIAWWWPTGRFNRLVQLEGMEQIEQLNGRGALLMAIHYTTLEIGASALSSRHSIDGMYRAHKNPVYDYVQSRGRRARDPVGVVYPREDVRGMFKALRQGRIIWYAPDQDYGRKQSVFASFFGVQAASVTATARFAKTGNAAVLPFSHVRLPGSRGYRVTIHPPLENFPVGDDVVDAETVNRKVEEFILQQPDQYMWIHRRFKTRPEGEVRPYPKSNSKK